MAHLTHADLLTVFQECQASLCHFLTRMLRCEETAREIVQEVYLRLARVTQPSDIEQPRAFVFKVAANLAVDHRRRQERRSLRETTESLLDELPCPTPGPDATLATQEQIRLLREAIAELPPKCRAVFLLHKAKHLTYGEIAVRLGISRSAVEKHISKALAHCRDRLNHR